MSHFRFEAAAHRKAAAAKNSRTAKPIRFAKGHFALAWCLAERGKVKPNSEFIHACEKEKERERERGGGVGGGGGREGRERSCSIT